MKYVTFKNNLLAAKVAENEGGVKLGVNQIVLLPMPLGRLAGQAITYHLPLAP